jgi:hypothetical protein
MITSQSLHLALFVAVMTMTGCVVAPIQRIPTPQELDPGPKPTQEDANTAIKAHLREVLKDPDSIKDYELKSIVSHTWSDGGKTGVVFYNAGWAACASYNAKNSYGGYVGKSLHTYLVRRTDKWYVSKDETFYTSRTPCWE